MKTLQEETIELSGVKIILQYKAVQRINLRIDKQGHAVVSLPTYKKAEAIAFVKTKLEWLRKHLEQYSSSKALPNPDNGFDGKNIWLWSKCYKARFVKTSINERVLMKDKLLVFTYKGVLSERRQEQLVERFYRECMAKMVEVYLQKWQPILNLYCSSYKLRRLKSKWGRCTINTKELLFNISLVHRPVVCLEYVVLHELAHLYEASHNSRFKAFLSYYMQDWQAKKKLLNEFFFQEG